MLNDTIDKTLGGLLPQPLSTLMRKGAEMTPQAFEYFAEPHGKGLEFSETNPATATCAFGAVAHAILGGAASIRQVGMMGMEVQHEMYVRDLHLLVDTIVSMNNDDRRTREQISDWLAERGW